MTLDATKPENTDFVISWPAYIREARDAVNTLEALVGGEYMPEVSGQNISATISTFNQVYTVNSASAVVLTLDETTADDVGAFLEIHKLGIGDLTITAGGSDTIADGGAGTSISNTTAGEAKAAHIILRCVAVGQWMIHSILGSWA